MSTDTNGLEPYSKKRVLIIDELEAFRFSAKQALMSLGMKLVDTVNNASAALNSFQSVNYDLVLCNYDLGKGKKNGQELLEELRFKKLLKFTSLFFIVSAEVERSKVMGTIENEPDGYLVKPVTPKDLKDRLGKALAQKEALKKIDQAIDDGDLATALAFCDEHLSAKKVPYLSACSKTKAWLLTKTGQYKEAETFFVDYLARSQAVWAQFGLAKVLMKLNKHQDAEKCLQDILEVDPDHVEAMDLLASLLQLKGKTNEAQDLIQQAIQRSPNSLLRQKSLADLCVLNKDPGAAIDAFKNVIKLGDQSIYATPEQFFDYAQFLTSEASKDESGEHQADIEEAFALLGKAEKRFAQNTQIESQSALMKACLNASLGEDEEAERLMSEIQAKKDTDDNFSVSTLQVMAKAMHAMGKSDEAEKVLEEAADLAAANRQDVEEVYDRLDQSISSEARVRAAAFNKKGIQLYTKGEIEQAATELRMAMPLTPRHISLNLNLIQVLLKLRQSSPDKVKKSIQAEIDKALYKVRHIPEHHHEYARYCYLRDKFKAS